MTKHTDTAATVLIVRPAERAAADIATCRKAGWTGIAFSPIAIEPDKAALEQLPALYAGADAVFWASPTAVETALPHLDVSDGRKTHIAVGAATAAVLAEHMPSESEIHAPAEGNDSEAVLRLDIWNRLDAGARILLVRGHGGRGLLAQALAARGFAIDSAEIYFRRPQTPDWQVFAGGDVRAAYVTSAEQAALLFADVPPQFAQSLRSLLYFTHHPRIAAALSQAGAQHVRLIERFDEAVLQTASAGAHGTPQSGAAPPISNTQPGQSSGAPTAGNAMSDQKPAAPAPQTPQVPAAAPVVIKQSSGKGLAAGALILALLSLGASGFLFVQGQNVLKNQELSFAQKIDKAALDGSQNASMLQDSLRRQEEIRNEINRLSAGFQQNSNEIAVANRAFHELQKGRVNWLVDETETMLNQASQQLLISGDVAAAIAVLEHIESRLSRFDQPELLPIKQAVANDLTQLKTRPSLDISGTALRLDRLETAVAGLPLIVDGTLQPGARAPETPAPAGLPWWQNAWQKTLDTLKGLVEVRRIDNADAMMIAPEQIYFVRENLRLRLLDARIALMQHSGEIYQSDLNLAEAAVKQYFDQKSPATQSWLKELAELKALEVRMVSDDSLKASLNAVNSFQEARRIRMASEGFGDIPAAAASAAAPAAPASAASAPAAAMPKAPALPSESKPAAPAAQPDAKPASAPAKAPESKPAAPAAGQNGGKPDAKEAKPEVKGAAA